MCQPCAEECGPLQHTWAVPESVEVGLPPGTVFQKRSELGCVAGRCAPPDLAPDAVATLCAHLAAELPAAGAPGGDDEQQER